MMGMTREELKAHCEKQIEDCEMWAKRNRREPCGKIYEEHKLILELLKQETVSKEVYDHEYFLRKEFEMKIARLEQQIARLEQQEPTTKNDKVDCKHTDCNNCVNHKYCDYEPTAKNNLGVEKIVDVLGSYTDLDIPYKHKIAEDILNNLPPVTPQIRKGHWIKSEIKNAAHCVCSECGDYWDITGDLFAFCPNCGAKMVESEEQNA